MKSDHNSNVAIKKNNNNTVVRKKETPKKQINVLEYDYVNCCICIVLFISLNRFEIITNKKITFFKKEREK